MQESSLDGSTSTRPLEDFGWTAEIGEELAALAVELGQPGRVIRVDRGRCDVVVADGAEKTAVVHADTSPVLDADSDASQGPCTGDWVVVSVSADGASISAVLRRRTALVRSTASQRSEGQVLAANVDTVAIAVALDTEPDLARIERFLALAWESGAQPLLVLTKADLASDAQGVRETVVQAAPGVDVLVVCATSGEGMDVLAASLWGTSVLVGPSGAGKSTIVNALLGRSAMDVNQTRRDGKGRHTTTTRELMTLPAGGVLIDTPGIRGVGLFDAAEGLQQTFSEIEKFAEDCRFNDCEHDTEPGCAVQQAIEDGVIAQRRLDSYRKLVSENEWIASRSDARLRQERAKALKAQGREGMANMMATRR